MAIFFALFVVTVLLILSLILLILNYFFKDAKYLNIIPFIWVLPVIFAIILTILHPFTTKMKLDKNEIYGEYVIDREQFAGKQANWQYNHYRFKITEDNKIYFYITENEKIIKTYEGTISIYEFGSSPFLNIKTKDPKFHIINENPTLYRKTWSFYYVFHSKKYGNVFFKKGNWKEIN